MSSGACGARPRAQRPLVLEIAALTTFVFARPVLSSLGRSSETFLTRGADWTDIATFVAVLVALPVLGLVVVDTAAGVVSVRAQRWVHVAAVGALGALAAWQIIGHFADTTFLPVVGPTSILVGVLASLGRLRTEAVGSFLRYGALIVVVVVVQFVLMSPSGGIVLGGRHTGLDPAVRAEVAAAVGDDAPPVVLMVFDALPTEVLLDGQGGIDPELYPNLAELAGTSTWYRHNTTVAPATIEAVPAILSGRLGDVTTSPVAGRYPHNVFTMLGGSYDLHALEPITGLCPVAQCPVAAGSPLPDLLDDRADRVERADGHGHDRRVLRAGCVRRPLRPSRGLDRRPGLRPRRPARCLRDARAVAPRRLGVPRRR